MKRISENVSHYLVTTYDLIQNNLLTPLGSVYIFRVSGKTKATKSGSLGARAVLQIRLVHPPGEPREMAGTLAGP